MTEWTEICRDIDHLKKQYYESDNKSILAIPQRWDNHDQQMVDYDIGCLNDKQSTIVIMALDAIIKFLNNDPDYRPFRATVVGAGGTGKSHIINTLVATVRRYTQTNESIMVTAPTGAAAYNVGGSTLHRSLSIPTRNSAMANQLSDKKEMIYLKKSQNCLRWSLMRGAWSALQFLQQVSVI